MNSTFSSLTVAQLRQAIAIREKIEALEKQLASILGEPAAAPATPAKTRVVSPQARARMAAAQRARWAKTNRIQPAAPAAAAAAKPSGKQDRKITTAGRRRLSELAKARWARVKASGKSSLGAS